MKTTIEHKTKTVYYDLKSSTENRIFEKSERFTFPANSAFWSNVEQKVREKFSRPDQFISIDHVSRLIKVNYI